MSWSSFWDSLLTPLRASERSSLSRLRMADRWLKNTQRISMVLLIAVLVFVTSSGLNNEVLGQCPKDCQCYNFQVDCSQRAFHSVPKGIPRNSEKIDLQGNNLTIIRLADFAGLVSLRILQLSENEIHTLEKGSFQDLASLERLRLNNNQLRSIPDLLFANSPNLNKLDLSHNQLSVMRKRSLLGPSSLRTLILDHNHLTCIDESSIRPLKDLESLTLESNNLTSLHKDAFEELTKLRQLSLGENPLICDCHLIWLSRWQRKFQKYSTNAKCNSPYHMREKTVDEVQEPELKCSGVIERTWSKCGGDDECPHPCVCADGVVDCRDLALRHVPDSVPEDVIELRLEQNEITEIPPGAFSTYRRLRRLDLSNNQIQKISVDAFRNLKSLTSLVLYGNRISVLPPGLFHGLTSLQLLLLNANRITCVRRDVFRDLHNLNLLSLYDNNIKSLENGTFEALQNIQTLHLARNPFFCDCRLRWLSDYLHRNPIETSGAKCEGPKRLQRKRLAVFRDEKMKCDAEESKLWTDECAELKCPAECSCEGTTVDCSRSGLREVPQDIPEHVTQLILSGNELSRIRIGWIHLFPNLQKLELSGNRISAIEDSSFRDANSIVDVVLSGNKLKEINNKMFLGLSHLKTLSLADNQISCIMPGSFEHMPNLQSLDLDGNGFICNCHLAWFADWLRREESLLGSDGPKCNAPLRHKDNLIRSLPSHEFRCTSEDRGCLGEEYCPPQCNCTGTVVWCSRARLREIPSRI